MEITRLPGSGLRIDTKTASFDVVHSIKNAKFAPDLDFALSIEPFQDKDKISQKARVFSWPGEYEVKSVAVHGFMTDEEAKALFFVVYGVDFKLCILPLLTKELHSDLVEKIGDVDMLIMNAGTDEKIIRNVIEEIGPKSILPFSLTGNAAEETHIITKLGLTPTETQSKISIKTKNDLKADQMGVYMLS